MTREEAERRSLELNRERIADSPAALAERLISARWYYPVTGVWLGGLIAAGPLVAESLIGSLAFCVAMFAFVWLPPRAYRHATDFWVPGRRAWAWLIALMLPVVGIFIAGWRCSLSGAGSGRCWPASSRSRWSSSSGAATTPWLRT